MNVQTQSTAMLKEEYIVLCTAAMVYGTDTKARRQEIADEIEKRERDTERRFHG